MKKSIMISLIVAGALVLFGAGLFAGAMTAVGWDFSILNTYEVVNNTYDVDEPFTNISIDTDTVDIRFAKSSDGKCRVATRDTSNHIYSVAVEDGTLHIRVDFKGLFEIGIGVYDSFVTVYLPEDAYGALTIKEDTGDIEIPGNFSFESMDIELDTGDVVSHADVTGTCRIEATTGDIKVENASVGALALRTTSGDIAVSDVVCAGNFSANVRTGDTFLTNLICTDLTSTGTTGELKLTNVITSGKIDIMRDTGDVTFEGADAASIKVETSTGDVTGTLLSDKIFRYKTSTGRVELPPTTTGGICEITTDTGDIQIEFE
ncbi:MAG: DUF4097 family beta strand repeat protein [Clostridia bacterium]|nr:DUF4097 family beta strand repeat protein [Clostridia bacterium]